MSVPKQRHTKGRKNRRRANIKITAKKMVACSECKKIILGHQACPHCGFYKGKKAVDLKIKSKSKGKKEKKTK